MKDKHDFDQQMNTYGEKLRTTRYPYGEAELDREIRRALWSTTPSSTAAAQKSRRRWWPYAAAAACVAALILPLGRWGHGTDGIRNVSIDGEQVYFACNSGCSPEETIETLKTLIR